MNIERSLRVKNCDLCKSPLTSKFVDGRTRAGSWGNMCPDCHTRYGVGLGTGRGQEYEKVEGQYVKIGG